MKHFIEMLSIRLLLTVVLIIASPAILWAFWQETKKV